jgi:hypothetical protein
VFIEDSEEPEFWNKEPAEVKEAIDIAYDTFSAGTRDAALPERLPRCLVSEYAKLGQALHEGEAMELAPPNKKPLKLTPSNRESLVPNQA